MIPLKINGKRHSIKQASELTTAEFVQLQGIYEGIGKEGKSDIQVQADFFLAYLSWSTGLDLKTVFLSRIPDSLPSMIGSITDEGLEMPSHILGKPVKRYVIDSIGQRFMVETSNRKGYDLLLFTCAVALARSEDYTVIEGVREALMKLPYIEVLPVARFFFLNLRSGRSSGESSFRSYVKLIRMKISGNRRAKQT